MTNQEGVQKLEVEQELLEMMEEALEEVRKLDVVWVKIRTMVSETMMKMVSAKDPEKVAQEEMDLIPEKGPLFMTAQLTLESHQL